MLLTISGTIYILNSLQHNDAAFAYCTSLAIIGCANLLGLLLRLFSAKSLLNILYLISILFFGFLSYILHAIDAQDGLYFMGIGGATIHVYYLFYGLLLLYRKKFKKNETEI